MHLFHQRLHPNPHFCVIFWGISAKDSITISARELLAAEHGTFLRSDTIQIQIQIQIQWSSWHFLNLIDSGPFETLPILHRHCMPKFLYIGQSANHSSSFYLINARRASQTFYILHCHCMLKFLYISQYIILLSDKCKKSKCLAGETKTSWCHSLLCNLYAVVWQTGFEGRLNSWCLR